MPLRAPSCNKGLVWWDRALDNSESNLHRGPQKMQTVKPRCSFNLQYVTEWMYLLCRQ